MSKEEANYTTLGSCAKCEPNDWKDLLYSQQLRLHYKNDSSKPLENIYYYIRDEKNNECYGKTDSNGLTNRFFTENPEKLTVYIGKKAYHYLKTNKKIKV
jgi:hypothetical protein